jgi:hypothetical protein
MPLPMLSTRYAPARQDEVLAGVLGPWDGGVHGPPTNLSARRLRRCGFFLDVLNKHGEDGQQQGAKVLRVVVGIPRFRQTLANPDMRGLGWAMHCLQGFPETNTHRS